MLRTLKKLDVVLAILGLIALITWAVRPNELTSSVLIVLQLINLVCLRHLYYVQTVQIADHAERMYKRAIESED